MKNRTKKTNNTDKDLICWIPGCKRPIKPGETYYTHTFMIPEMPEGMYVNEEDNAQAEAAFHNSGIKELPNCEHCITLFEMKKTH